MRKRKRDIPFRLLKRIFGKSAEAHPTPENKPPEPMPEPPPWLRQNVDNDIDHNHSHEHSHDHGHSHDHKDPVQDDKTDEKSKAIDTPEPVQTSPNILVDAMETPNPNAIKFSTNQTVTESSFSASSVKEAQNHPLAKAIFEHPGVKNVFGVNDFITVLKSEDSDWRDLEGPIIDTIVKTLGQQN